MIDIFVSNNIIYPFDATHNGLVTLLDGIKINAPTPEYTCCICSCSCNYSEKVFSEAGAISDPSINDKTALLFTKIIAGDSIKIYLCYGTTRTQIVDNTYGSYYPAGFFSLKPLYVGFLADWNLIYKALGAGSYWFEIETTLLGVSKTIYSICYDLTLYDCHKANFTVRIESYNTGVILDSLFDYAKMIELPNGWYQSVRLGGKVFPKLPKITVDNYYDQDYQLLQIQDKISNTYELETHLLPASISNQIIYDNMLANKILISDYNISNEEIIRQINLYPTEINKNYPGQYQNNCRFTLKFTTRFDSTIKNNW